jgi:hypothetical protein
VCWLRVSIDCGLDCECDRERSFNEMISKSVPGDADPTLDTELMDVLDWR